MELPHMRHQRGNQGFLRRRRQNGHRPRSNMNSPSAVFSGSEAVDGGGSEDSRRTTMSFKAIRHIALATTFLASSAMMAQAQTSSTIGAGGSSVGSGSVGTVLGTGGSSA